MISGPGCAVVVTQCRALWVGGSDQRWVRALPFAVVRSYVELTQAHRYALTLVSLGLGLAGALVGYLIVTLGLGIGDTDIFDWGGLVGAIIGTLIVLGLARSFLRRRQPGPGASTPSPDEWPRPVS